MEEYGVNANWLLAGKGRMFQKDAAAHTPATTPGDPIARRIETVERVMKVNGASKAEICAAVMAALRAGETRPAEDAKGRKVGNSDG